MTLRHRIKVRKLLFNGVWSYEGKTPRGLDPGGGYTSISLTGMLVREQISTTPPQKKNRMTLNSNPQKIEGLKIQTQKK